MSVVLGKTIPGSGARYHVTPKVSLSILRRGLTGYTNYLGLQTMPQPDSKVELRGDSQSTEGREPLESERRADARE